VYTGYWEGKDTAWKRAQARLADPTSAAFTTKRCDATTPRAKAENDIFTFGTRATMRLYAGVWSTALLAAISQQREAFLSKAGGVACVVEPSTCSRSSGGVIASHPQVPRGGLVQGERGRASAASVSRFVS
jgi:hypothetical protein